jgi:putative SOS response-associated peptidase YedK
MGPGLFDGDDGSLHPRRRIRDRMPVVLQADDWTHWTDALADEARALCVPYSGEMVVTATEEPWTRR